MNVVIIEDEELAVEKLVKSIKQIDPKIIILATLESVEESVSWLQNNKADLIFLDIHLSDGLSFQIFNQLEIKTPVIFTTAFDQYAIRAFKVNSIDYLLKPIRKIDLEFSIRKFKELQGNSISRYEITEVVKSINLKMPEYQKRFLVTSGDRIKSILLAAVSYFFAEGKYCFLVEKNGEQHLLNNTLEGLTENLDPAIFFKVNRNYIVSIESIKEMYAYSKSRVKIILSPPAQKDVIVSTERSAEFKKWLNG